MRSCSDGPARYARFVALGSLRADAGGLTVVDGGRVRRLAWATGLVDSPTGVTDASMAVTAGPWMLVVHTSGTLTAHTSGLLTSRLNGASTSLATGVLDAALLLDSAGTPVAYYLASHGMFRRALTDAAPEVLDSLPKSYIPQSHPTVTPLQLLGAPRLGLAQ